MRICLKLMQELVEERILYRIICLLSSLVDGKERERLVNIFVRLGGIQVSFY